MRLITLILASTFPVLGHASLAEDYQAPCLETQATMESVRPAAKTDGGAPQRAAAERKSVTGNIDHRAGKGGK